MEIMFLVVIYTSKAEAFKNYALNNYNNRKRREKKTAA